MPTEIETKGAAALQRVKRKIPNLGSLTSLIRAKNPTGNITSCALTASILGDVIDPAWFFNSALTIEHMAVQSTAPKPKKSSGGFGDMTAGLRGETGVKDAISLRQEQRVEKIERLLEQPKLVSITIIPDHHFVVFPVSATDLVVLQGFQDTYNLLTWMAKTRDGVTPKKGFLLALSMLVGGNRAERIAGAQALFACDAGSARDVGNYYAEAAMISAISHKGL